MSIPFDAHVNTAPGRYMDRLTGVHDASRTIAAQAATLGPTGSALTRAARRLEQSEDLRSARDAFGVLSDALITLGRPSDSRFGGAINVAYCPMLRKHWLQRGTAIRNPYYGSQMLECGRLK